MLRQGGVFLQWGLVALGFLALTRPASGDVIPPARRTTWNPGIPGGIPAVTTVHTTINASVYGDGITDATAAINNAIQAAGAAAASSGVRQVVYLPPGTYRTTKSINLNRSNVVLRGAGSGLSRIRLGSSSGDAAVRMGVYWPDYGSAVDVVGSVPKGATSITVANASGIQVGDVLQTDQLDDTGYVRMGDCAWYKRGPHPEDVNGPSSPGGYRSVGQQVEVASKSGNVLGLAGPIHIAFDAARSPQVFKTATVRSGEPGTRYIGLEDLYVTGGNNDNISALNLAYCWIKNVESDGSTATGPGMTGAHISLSHAYRCEVRGSYVHHARNINPGGGAYGVSVRMQSSDNLIEDNVMYMLNKPLLMEASGGGNVVGYNYVDEAIIASNTSWQESAVDGNHCSFPHDDLFEGNWASNIGSDTTHGNVGWQTFFRNYAPGRNTSGVQTGNVRAVGIDGYSREHNIVGNVLLTPNLVVNGLAPVYDCVDNGSCMNAAAVYRVGAGAMGGDYYTRDDGTAFSLLYRHGNYDYVTNSVIWDPTNADHSLPASLYRAAKPTFFGALAWPWVDPVGTTKVATLPAKARFDSGMAIMQVQVTSVTPVSGPIAGGTTVTIRGSGFTAGTTVTIGGVAATGVVVSGSTSLTAVTGPHATGLADVTVTIPGPYSATLTEAFFYVPPAAATDFNTVTPCRLLDTRQSGSVLAAYERRAWTVTGRCALPAAANALAVNLTVVAPTAPGFIRLTPGNGLSETSSINFVAGATRANNSVILLATDGSGRVAAYNGSAGTVHVVLDVTGYFQ
jgi:hypothetical protein